ncbi:protein mono-ADP-ribosyltransferase PARP14-like [Ptychodera flava]|uniref:protein mono-ADP-ribosyltransferase PARP14-like n=1 Tax=Ptychodera flava TaxID=63121 RepID=UPI00396A4EE5
MQLERDDLLRENRTSFVTGQAVSTRAGMMVSCSRVIYVFGPEWDKGGENSRMVDLLTDAVYSSLKEADEHTCPTVAIPPISAEFGFPLDLCIDTIVKAIDEYWNGDKTSVTKIFLIHQVPRKCKTIVEAVQSAYNLKGDDMKSHDLEPDKENQKTTMHGFRPDSNAAVSSMAPSPGTQTIKYIDQTRVMTPEGKNVNLIVGDMATQKVDIMVNSVGPNLDLTAGAASKAIYSAAGTKMKSELSAVTKGRPPKAGDAFVTGGAKLSVKHVIHTICCGWIGPQPEKTLRDILRECFRIAVYKSATSIAFPAIGTGNLGFPRDVVAKIMYEEAEIFSRNHPNSALTDIRFVVYARDQQTIQSFMNKIQMYASQQPIHGGPSAVSKPRRHERGESRLNSAKGEPLYKDLDLQDVGWQMSIGSIRVHVIAGDITSEKVDAIVTEINKDLEPTTDISGLIINKGGAEVRRELKSLANHHHSKAHITAAGELPCKKLIHAVMENTKVKAVIQAILELADTSQLTSIAMPSIGLGHGNKDAKEIAHKTLKYFSIFVENNKETVLNTIKIVTSQTKLVEIYNQAMIDIIGDQKKTSKSGISKMLKLPSTNTPASGEEDETIPVTKQETRMVLDIYADTERNIDQAIEKIDTFLARELNTFEIDKPSVKSLTRRQIEEIEQFSKGCNVDFKRIITGRVHHLKLHGMPRDIIKVSSMINDILDKIEKEEQSHREAEILAKNVKWCFKDGENYEEYERQISTLIEQACHKRQPEVEFEIHGGRYKIIFKRMVEISIDDGSQVPVQRFLTEDAIPLPPNWEPMSPDEPFLSVPLDRSTPEYLSVKSAFIERLAETHKITDIQIERVQNSKLYRQYIISKQNMTARLSGVQIERMLYHGTKEESCSLINANGFNRSFAGQNAALYGNGCYFAVQSQYSAGGMYSPPDANGYKYIYQCCVLTGEYTPGHQGMLVPPPKNQNKPTVCYESVVDKLDDPKIFVIFNDAVAYPEYLIKFKEGS